VSAFKAKGNNNNNSASIILKSWDNLSNSSKAKEWTGNMLDYAQDKVLRDVRYGQQTT
jgi:hypothetical protein